VRAPAVDGAIVAAVEGGVAPYVPVGPCSGNVFTRQLIRIMEVRMGVPFAQYLGTFRDLLQGQRRVDHALALATTIEVVGHGAGDPAIHAIDEPEVLVPRRPQN